MAVRGVYTEAEQKMIDDTNKKADELVGWVKPETTLAADEDSVKLWANSVDYWNPLWRDDNYARDTRWGSIIAAPFYQDRFWTGNFIMQTNPECGPTGRAEVGGECEFSKPIHVNDRFRLWNNRPVFEDSTSEELGGMRSFVVTSSASLINQKDELVSISKITLGNLFPATASPDSAGPHGGPPSGGPAGGGPGGGGPGGGPPGGIPGGGTPAAWLHELHQYTPEELEFIKRTEDEEEIRGANIRYWEDVNADDDLKPVISGPTTVLDMIQFGGMSILTMPPIRELRRSGAEEIQVDPETGVTHVRLEAHYADRPASLFSHGKHALIFSTFGRSLLARLVTNWMGDDGFLRKLRWVNRGTDLLKGALREKFSGAHYRR